MPLPLIGKCAWALQEPVVATAEFADMIRGLIVLLFVFGPMLTKVLKREEDRPVTRPAPPRRRPTGPRPSKTSSSGPQPSDPLGEASTDPAPVTWKDLLEGRVQTPPPPPSVAVEYDEEEDFEEVVEPVATQERDWGRDPFAFESQDLVPDEKLKPAPSEEWLERQEDVVEATSQDFIDALELDTESDSAPTSSDHLSRRRSFLRGRDDLRRAIVLAEVLAPPVALRNQDPGASSSKR